mmetsp:Transcript_88652/g.286359  ORF Transcript_88652/g.286359 Transcript_88652/m.286359 type:complete len:285 (+) Transcript_88652:372-1226(+)
MGAPRYTTILGHSKIQEYRARLIKASFAWQAAPARCRSRRCGVAHPPAWPASRWGGAAAPASAGCWPTTPGWPEQSRSSAHPSPPTTAAERPAPERARAEAGSSRATAAPPRSRARLDAAPWVRASPSVHALARFSVSEPSPTRVAPLCFLEAAPPQPREWARRQPLAREQGLPPPRERRVQLWPSVARARRRQQRGTRPASAAAKPRAELGLAAPSTGTGRRTSSPAAGRASAAAASRPGSVAPSAQGAPRTCRRLRLAASGRVQWLASPPPPPRDRGRCCRF